MRQGSCISGNICFEFFGTVLTRKSAYIDEPINDDLRLEEYNVEQVIRYTRNLERVAMHVTGKRKVLILTVKN
jgi:hypothetical protein